MSGAVPILRVARPTNALDAVERFYCAGLGFIRLGGFENHDGFDGVMLGHPDWPYHLEFTREHGVVAPAAPGKEHLLVFYFPEHADYSRAVARMLGAGYPPVAAHNPYWDRQGTTFEDPDLYRVVLQGTASPV